MAGRFDVTGRLAEGGTAVDDFTQYVRACEQLGYQDRDLTGHPAQLADWYDSENGLDLGALHADCAALDAAASATERALQVQDEQLAALFGAWQGAGAESARDFLRAHGAACARAAGAVRGAAETLAALRDNLWRIVDAKVAATQAVDDRHQAQRAAWLTAAQIVTTGAGDRVSASELVGTEVEPFVDNDIRLDWVTAMRAARDAVADSFDDATTAVKREPVVFAVPEDLGPTWSPAGAAAAPTPAPEGVAAAPTTPAGINAPPVAPAAAPPTWAASPSWSVPAAAAAPFAPPPPAAAPVEPAAAVEPAAVPSAALPSLPSMPGLGGSGGGFPEIGSGLSGLGQQFADLIGGLQQPPDDMLPDPLDLDEASDRDEPEADEFEADLDEEEDDADEETDVEEPEPDDVDAAVLDDAVAENPDCCEEPVIEPIPTEPVPTSAPPPPPLEPAPAAPLAAAATPCEIAADELPHAGE